jgi:hypothetical protein
MTYKIVRNTNILVFETEMNQASEDGYELVSFHVAGGSGYGLWLTALMEKK